MSSLPLDLPLHRLLTAVLAAVLCLLSASSSSLLFPSLRSSSAYLCTLCLCRLVFHSGTSPALPSLVPTLPNPCISGQLSSPSPPLPPSVPGPLSYLMPLALSPVWGSLAGVALPPMPAEFYPPAHAHLFLLTLSCWPSVFLPRPCILVHLPTPVVPCPSSFSHCPLPNVPCPPPFALRLCVLSLALRPLPTVPFPPSLALSPLPTVSRSPSAHPSIMCSPPSLFTPGPLAARR